MVITTSGAPASPTSSSSPRPPVPRTPSPCASSTISSAPWRRQTSCRPRSGARSPSALKTESVITTARSSSRADSAVLDRRDVAMRRHRHPRPRQPAGIDEGRMGQRVGDQQRTGPGERDDRAEVGGVARREHQRRLGADEVGQRGLEALVQFGVAGDQPGPGRPGAPGAQRGDAAVDHVGMLGQAEVVVGRQVEFGADRRARAQRPAQPGRAALPLDVVEPGQRGNLYPRHDAPSRRCRQLNTVQVSARATPTIAEVICPISSRSADVGRHGVDQVAERAQPDAVLERRRRGHRHVDRFRHLDDADGAEHPDVGDAGQRPRRLEAVAQTGLDLQNPCPPILAEQQLDRRHRHRARERVGHEGRAVHQRAGLVAADRVARCAPCTGWRPG